MKPSVGALTVSGKQRLTNWIAQWRSTIGPTTPRLHPAGASAISVRDVRRGAEQSLNQAGHACSSGSHPLGLLRRF
jgi:hypothetical protein